MSKMIVRGIASEISIEVLNGVIDVILGGNLGIITVGEIFAILVCTIGCNLGCGKDGLDGEKVEGIGSGGLLASVAIGYDRDIGIKTVDVWHRLHLLIKHGLILGEVPEKIVVE